MRRLLDLPTRHLAVALALLAGGCALPVATGSETSVHPSHASIRQLRTALIALGPTVSPSDATRLSEHAHRASRQLARDYRSVGSPHFQNFLVNTGFRKRGLCYHWTEDLMHQLQALHLASLELHWADAHARALREHNCVVVTARGQPFADGIVLDGWRHSGRLFWSPVRTDHYPWQEDESGYMRRAGL